MEGGEGERTFWEQLQESRQRQTGQLWNCKHPEGGPEIAILIMREMYFFEVPLDKNWGPTQLRHAGSRRGLALPVTRPPCSGRPAGPRAGDRTRGSHFSKLRLGRGLRPAASRAGVGGPRPQPSVSRERPMPAFSRPLTRQTSRPPHAPRRRRPRSRAPAPPCASRRRGFVGTSGPGPAPRRAPPLAGPRPSPYSVPHGGQRVAGLCWREAAAAQRLPKRRR
jgi:hypothetical protein